MYNQPSSTNHSKSPSTVLPMITEGSKHPEATIDEISQQAQGEIPNNVGPHTMSLYYKIRELSQIIMKQLNIIQSQADTIVHIEKDKMDMKKSVALADNCEREMRRVQEKMAQMEKSHGYYQDNEKVKIQELEMKITDIERARDNEKKKYQKNLEVYTQKIESINFIEMENKVNQEEIEELKKDKEKLLKDTEEVIRKKEINNQNKYSQLKKKMFENLHETKRNVTNLNLEYIDVSDKLTILQNQQLLVQLEYQATRIDELDKKNKLLHDKVFALERELEVHREVALTLADKAKNNIFNNGDRSLTDSNNVMPLATELNIIDLHKSITINSFEKKSIILEKKLKMKNDECARLKINNNELKYRIGQYEKKYKGLFEFFEESLGFFAEDNEIVHRKDLYINIDQIKKCDFNIFSPEEKYSLLVLMMKYLLPIVSLNLNSGCNMGNGLFETNLNLINHRVTKNDKYLNDPTLKKAFVGKNNKINDDLMKNNMTYSFGNAIPIMRKTQSEADPRLNNSRYKAVFL